MEFEPQQVSGAVARCSVPSTCGKSAEEMLLHFGGVECKTISLSDLQLFVKLQQEQHLAGSLWLHELLQGVEPVLPIFKQERKPDPDLAPRLTRLRLAQENQEYVVMMGDVYKKRGEGYEEADMDAYRSQISVGLNLLVSMSTMFCVGFWAGGTVAEPYGVRATMCGLALMCAILLLEMTLFLIRASRMDKQVHQRERRVARGAHFKKH